MKPRVIKPKQGCKTTQMEKAMHKKISTLITMAATAALALGLLLPRLAQSSEQHIATPAEKKAQAERMAKLKPSDRTELQALKKAQELDKAAPLMADDEKDPPENIVIPSVVGEIRFPHSFHYDDQDIACTTCHHPVNAKPFKTPHNRIFKNSKTDCTACHGGPAKAENQACSNCHLSVSHAEGQIHLLDSHKVAVHKTCWACHEQGKGQKASKGCVFCHSGPKKGWKK